MNYKNFIERAFKLFTIITIFQLTSCDEDDFYLADSCFEVNSKYPLIFDILEENTGYVDSLYIFKNCSDSSRVKYEWDFGDGTFSSEKHPLHSYNKSGVYKITLSTYVDNKFADSTKKLFNVIIGQKAFKIDNVTYGISVAPSKDSGFYLLGASGESGSVINDWFLAKFNSELILEWKKTLWPAIAIATTMNGEILVTGKANELDRFRITKLSSVGDIIWDKEYDEASNAFNTYTTSLYNGNYVSIGHVTSPNIFNTLIAVNSEGNFIWKKDFINDDFSLSYKGGQKVVNYLDGCILATSKLNKLILVRIDINGNIVWEKQHDIPISSESITLAISSNSIYVGSINMGWNKIHKFDDEGAFLKTFDLENDILKDFILFNENLFYVADYSWDRISYGCINLSSNDKWNRLFYNYWTEGGQSSNWEGRGTSIIPLSNLDILIMGNRRDKSDYNFTSIFLAKLDKEGKLK
jgi:PKD repeat protein